MENQPTKAQPRRRMRVGERGVSPEIQGGGGNQELVPAGSGGQRLLDGTYQRFPGLGSKYSVGRAGRGKRQGDPYSARKAPTKRATGEEKDAGNGDGGVKRGCRSTWNPPTDLPISPSFLIFSLRLLI